MKFSEMPYSRPDLEQLKALARQTVEGLDQAGSAREQAELYYAFEKAEKTVETMGAIAYIHHSIDTRDEFYTREQDWMDEAMPQFEELRQQVNLALLRSPYRQQLQAGADEPDGGREQAGQRVPEALCFRHGGIRRQDHAPAHAGTLQAEH